MNRHICIHGHFYQPPRDNPWLEMVEQQDSAHPYHDWNERVTAECYGPNSAARVLNPDGRIVGINNNYSRISFNFGPTLLAWMAQAQPEIYAAILDADARSREIYGGHGGAIAQVYNHMIMPLANARDKRTQVRWGIEDFRYRFGRDPEGMWLAETAVDLESLDLLAEHGIRFTILAPRQAASIRPLGDEGAFRDVSGGSIDPRRPYLCLLPSGRTIALFFYDGPISQQLAFEGLLHDGVKFAKRLLDVRAEEQPDLVHIATDGESYGHHHRRGEMALAYCLHHVDAQPDARLTLYGQYLEQNPPRWEARIHERSSWSCVHGVERWCADCGCSSGGRPGWHQRWRKPLRDTLDWLRDELVGVYETQAQGLFRDPWQARDEYISVVLDRSPDNVRRFLDEQSDRTLDDESTVRALRLLEMQRHAMLMFTSCGWFFDEISGIEATQILRYAARAMQLATLAGADDLEPAFVERLREAEGNIADHPNGAVIYEKFVRPARVGLRRVAAHVAISSLFQGDERDDPVEAYGVRHLATVRRHAGRFTLLLGRMLVESRLTTERADLEYAVLHLGGQNVDAGVQRLTDEASFTAMRDALLPPFETGDVPETVRVLDRFFESRNYSLWHLFRDQQRDILERLFAEAEERIESFYRQVFHDQYQLVQAMRSMSMSPPAIYQATIDFVLNRDLRQALGQVPLDEQRVEALLVEISRWGVTVDKDSIGLLASRQLASLAGELVGHPHDAELLGRIERRLRIYKQLDAPLNLWRAQNALYQIGVQQFFLRSKMADRGDPTARDWVDHFRRVAELFEVRFES